MMETNSSNGYLSPVPGGSNLRTSLVDSGNDMNNRCMTMRNLTRQNEAVAVVLEEFKWNLKRLLREGYPEGLYLHELEETYFHWFGKRVSYDTFGHTTPLMNLMTRYYETEIQSDSDYKNWRSVFERNLTLHQTFVLKSIDRDIFKVKLRPGSVQPEEMKAILAMTDYSAYQAYLRQQETGARADQVCLVAAANSVGTSGLGDYSGVGAGTKNVFSPSQGSGRASRSTQVQTYVPVQTETHTQTEMDTIEQIPFTHQNTSIIGRDEGDQEIVRAATFIVPVAPAPRNNLNDNEGDKNDQNVRDCVIPLTTTPPASAISSISTTSSTSPNATTTAGSSIEIRDNLNLDAMEVDKQPQGEETNESSPPTSSAADNSTVTSPVAGVASDNIGVQDLSQNCLINRNTSVSEFVENNSESQNNSNSEADANLQIINDETEPISVAVAEAAQVGTPITKSPTPTPLMPPTTATEDSSTKVVTNKPEEQNPAQAPTRSVIPVEVPNMEEKKEKGRHVSFKINSHNNTDSNSINNSVFAEVFRAVRENLIAKRTDGPELHSTVNASITNAANSIANTNNPMQYRALDSGNISRISTDSRPELASPAPQIGENVNEDITIEIKPILEVKDEPLIAGISLNNDGNNTAAEPVPRDRPTNKEPTVLLKDVMSSGPRFRPVPVPNVEQRRPQHVCTYAGCSELFDSIQSRQAHIIHVHLLRGLKYPCQVPGCKNIYSRKEHCDQHSAECSSNYNRKRKAEIAAESQGRQQASAPRLNLPGPSRARRSFPPSSASTSSNKGIEVVNLVEDDDDLSDISDSSLVSPIKKPKSGSLFTKQQVYPMKCTFDGCNKILTSSISMNFHLIQDHYTSRNKNRDRENKSQYQYRRGGGGGSGGAGGGGGGSYGPCQWY